MAQQIVNAGTTAGDHTGEDLHSAFTKLNANCSELYALVGGGGTGYLAVTITAASTNDYNPGGGFPSSIARLDINPTTNAVALTGLLAGTDGQRLQIRNIGSTYTLTLNNANAGSAAANRFTGQGDAAIPPNGQTQVIYYALPNPRWSMG